MIDNLAQIHLLVAVIFLVFLVWKRRYYDIQKPVTAMLVAFAWPIVVIVHVVVYIITLRVWNRIQAWWDKPWKHEEV